MTQPTILISINAAWNIVNFRSGLIRALQAQGYRVLALAPSDSYSGRFEAMGVEFHPIAMDKQGISPLRDLLLLLRYWLILRRIRPDVFLAYTAKPNVYGSLAANLLGIPVINNVSGLGTAFIKQGLLTRIVSALYRFAFRRSRTVFFQNDEDLGLFIRHGLVAAAQARLLPGSGVDLARFAPTAAAGGDRPFTFLLIGRLLRDKGVEEFVAAARLLRERLPEARFQLLGPIDAPNRTALSAADVQEWVAEGLVDYLGEADDVRPHIAAADCIVLPSYREGLPRALLEGAAMARPLIATDVPGCRAVVDHGENGFLCAARDAGALADAMLAMARLPAERRAQLGASARAKVEARFGEGVVVRRYLQAVAEALGQEPA